MENIIFTDTTANITGSPLLVNPDMETTAYMNATTVNIPVDPHSPSYVTVLVYLLVMTFICGGNALVITAIIRTPVLQTVTNAFVVNLAIADFIIGVHAIPHIMTEFNPQLVDNYGACVFRMGSIVALCFVSIATLLAIAVERYIGILKPLHYPQIVTSRWAKLVITITWLYGIANALPNYAGVNSWRPGMACLTIYVLPSGYHYVTVSEVFLFTTVIAILYGLILHEIRKQQSRLASASGDTTSLKRNIHIAKTFLMVVGIFNFCWLPYCFLSLIATQRREVGAANKNFLLAYRLIVSLVYLNSAANPIVYALRMTTFRKAMKAILLGRGTTLSAIHSTTADVSRQDAADA